MMLHFNESKNDTQALSQKSFATSNRVAEESRDGAGKFLMFKNDILMHALHVVVYLDLMRKMMAKERLQKHLH